MINPSLLTSKFDKENIVTDWPKLSNYGTSKNLMLVYAKLLRVVELSKCFTRLRAIIDVLEANNI